MAKHMQMAAHPAAAPTFAFAPEMYRKLFPQEYAKKCVDCKVRPDGRAFEQARSVHVQTRVVETAASSSLVKFGRTTVMTAIKLAVGAPAVSTPDQGEIAIQAHLTPLCSNRFSVGRPSEEAHSISSQLTRIVLESRAVEMSDLSIERGKSAWKLFVDVYCIDHDGNVHDAALLSVIAALKTLRVPAVSINEADHVVSIQTDAEAIPLKMQHRVYSTTFGLLHGHVIVDPTSEEEPIATPLFTITYNNQGQLAGICKPGGACLAPQTLQQCMAIAKDRAQALDRIITSSASTT